MDEREEARGDDLDPIGRLIAGKYRLLRLLGAGGMGVVYEAENTWTRRRVAIKLLRASEASEQVAVDRFVQEARATAALRHPHIVDVLDLGREPEDGTLFIVQEFLEGTNLRAHLLEFGRPSPIEAAHILSPILHALEAAHAQGIVHRDVKPENIFLARDASGAFVPKLIDFGISKLLHGHMDSVAHRTRTGSLVGTPAYMSPEQARGDRSIDARTDVWSVGVVLYEMLSGRVPFDGATFGITISQVITADVPRIEAFAPELPRGLADVIHRALARDPGARYPSAAAFRSALLAHAALPVRPLELAPAAWRSRRVVVIGATSLTAIALAAWQLAGGPPSSPPTAPCPSDMALIPAGRFTMGSPDGEGDFDEHPQHRVRLRSFCLDRTEVSVASYRACAAVGRCAAPDAFRDARDDWDAFCNWGRPEADEHPVNCVDWRQAKTFCEWSGHAGGARRLPREAEWEYAARGPEGRKYPWGNQSPDGARANLCGDECVRHARRFGFAITGIPSWSDAHGATAPVTAFPAGARPEGLLNMAGNVWEWVEDVYAADAYARHDAEGSVVRAVPDASRPSEPRVVRGGGWNDGVSTWARSAFRLKVDPTYRNLALGFRCARGAR